MVLRNIVTFGRVDETPDDVPVTIDYGDAKLATHFKRADRVNARAALVLGEDELAARTIVVRDLATREQESRPFAGDPVATAADILAWYSGLAPAAGEAA